MIIIGGLFTSYWYVKSAERPKPSEQSQIYFEICDGEMATCVIDGDTFILNDERIRIADIDTPETNPPRCAYEKRLGEQATYRLQQLLNDGPFALVKTAGREHDQYGRTLAVVVRNGQSIGDTLIAEGLARSWTGRRMPWCV